MVYEGWSPDLPRGDAYVYMDAEDTCLLASSSEACFGAAPRLSIRNNVTDRLLVAFRELNRVFPPGSRITGAKLVLHPDGDVPQDAVVRVWRVTAPWRDGGADGTREAWGATWLDRFLNPGAPRRPWADGGAEREHEEVASLEGRLADFRDAGAGAVVLASEGLAGDVATWLARRHDNHGWLVAIQAAKPKDGAVFHSAETPAAALRPALIVTYEPGRAADAPPAPDGPDLAVTLIERLPRYTRYDDRAGAAYDRKPHHGEMIGYMREPDLADQRKGPEDGELVEFVGHVRNAGTREHRGALDLWWTLNDEVVRAVQPEVALPPGEETTVSLQWPWQAARDDHRTRVLALVADPHWKVPDAVRGNNRLQRYVGAKTVRVWVERSAYEYACGEVTALGSRSFEDVLQWHAAMWNETLMDKSRYADFAPDGVRERVAIDAIEIVPDGRLDPQTGLPRGDPGVRFDGEIGLPWMVAHAAGPEPAEAFRARLRRMRVTMDRDLLREATRNVLGGWDMTRTVVRPWEPDAPGDVRVVDDAGRPVSRGALAPFAGLMGGGDTRPDAAWTLGTGLYSPHTVGGLNSMVRYRGGWRSPWMLDVPKHCFVQLTSPDGVPLRGAEVRVWQSTSEGVTPAGRVEGDLVADRRGVVELPWQETGERADVQLPTRHRLNVQNPWGRLDPEGSNAVLMLRVDAFGQRDWRFVRADDFSRMLWHPRSSAGTLPLECRIAPAEVDLERNVARGAVVITRRNQEDARRLVDGDAATAWDGGRGGAGDFIEVRLPRTQDVGLIRLVKADGYEAFYPRFRIVTRATPDARASDEPFAEQGPRPWAVTVAEDKDVDPSDAGVRWVSYAARPRAVRVIRIEAAEGGAASLAEVRVYGVRPPEAEARR
jgi:hypothetical protein